MAKTKTPQAEPSSTPNPEQLHAIRHSLAHVLAIAVLEMFPEAKLGVGPATDDGFYYDFDLPRTLIPEDLPLLEETMRTVLAQNLGFEGEEIKPKAAIDALKQAEQPYKVELAEEFAHAGEPITFYRTGQFVDLCKGGHVASTTEIPADGFTLTRIAGAYWRGDQAKPQLQRIYGLAFSTKKELGQHLAMLEAAKARDHRKLGQELDLFLISDLVGGGLPLWTPRGTVLREELNGYVQNMRAAVGFQKVAVPHITKKDLYEKSGHWQKFSDELYRITTREGHEFAMKPMNCPHHAQIYANQLRSYRDLPQRYQETTMVYRDEQSGEVSGLSRVRSITQDDAHVFCRQAQIEGEVLALWNIIDTFYRTVDFPLEVHFARHEPEKLDTYSGNETQWQQAEAQLQKVLEQKVAKNYVDDLGEAAFYGPKIDFYGLDAIGRKHQVATIQLDFNQPEGFDLTCVNEDGEPERIVMIHCAIMGSIERFLSVLIEHFAGAFPLWLSPEQVRVLPIADRHNDTAAAVADELRTTGLRVEVDDRPESVGKKIREAETGKVPYMLILGDKEPTGSVSVRSYHRGNLGSQKVKLLAKNLTREVAEKLLPKSV